MDRVYGSPRMWETLFAFFHAIAGCRLSPARARVRAHGITNDLGVMVTRSHSGEHQCTAAK